MERGIEKFFWGIWIVFKNSTWTGSLRHAHVVHKPEVDVEVVRAGSPDAVLRTAEVLDQLDTATLALPDGWHVLHGEGVVEGILAPSENGRW